MQRSILRKGGIIFLDILAVLAYPLPTQLLITVERFLVPTYSVSIDSLIRTLAAESKARLAGVYFS